MKQRIATAVIGLTIFFAILALYQTIFLNISAAVIIFLALHEMFHVTGVWENKALSPSAFCLDARFLFLTSSRPDSGWYMAKPFLRWLFLEFYFFIMNRCITRKPRRLLPPPVLFPTRPAF